MRRIVLAAFLLTPSAASAFTFGNPILSGDPWTATNAAQIQTFLNAIDDCAVGTAVAGAGANLTPGCLDFLTLAEGNAAYEPLNANLVDGPAFAIDNAIPRFDGTTGKLIKGSVATLNDSGNMTAVSYGSTAADPADAGAVRLGNAESICWEASPAGTDVCISVDASEALTVPGDLTVGGTLTVSCDPGTQDCDEQKPVESTFSSGNPASGNVKVRYATNSIVLRNSAGTETTLGAGGGMTSFSAAGTSGTPQTITDGNALTIAAGDGVTTTAGATDTVTVAVDSTVSRTIASGTAALGTAAIASAACATTVTVAAAGVLTTDAISWTPNADISTVTGYTPATTGGLTIYPFPTAGNVSFKVCNPSSASITPGAVTLNWRVVR